MLILIYFQRERIRKMREKYKTQLEARRDEDSDSSANSVKKEHSLKSQESDLRSSRILSNDSIDDDRSLKPSSSGFIQNFEPKTVPTTVPNMLLTLVQPSDTEKETSKKANIGIKEVEISKKDDMTNKENTSRRDITKRDDSIRKDEISRKNEISRRNDLSRLYKNVRKVDTERDDSPKRVKNDVLSIDTGSIQHKLPDGGPAHSDSEDATKDTTKQLSTTMKKVEICLLNENSQERSKQESTSVQLSVHQMKQFRQGATAKKTEAIRFNIDDDVESSSSEPEVVDSDNDNESDKEMEDKVRALYKLMKM